MPRFRLKPPEFQQKESHVARACVNWLGLHGYKAERLSSGLFWTDDGRRHPEGRPGRPDYAVMHRRYPGFYLETKATNGKLSRAQEIEHMHLRCGWELEVAVVNSVHALAEWVEEREKRISAQVVSERAEKSGV